MRGAAALGFCLLAACVSTGRVAGPLLHPPAVGSNLVLEGPVAAAPGHHLVMGDLVAQPATVIPRHSHSGEEFLYVIGGSTVLSRRGGPDLLLKPGQGVRIAPGVVHWGTAGEEGLRAVSTWIVVNGQPLRTPAP